MRKSKIVFFYTFISLSLITVIYITLFNTSRIFSDSMAETILQGDIILSKSYVSSIKRGRIILFTSSTERDVTYIKRCIALPGDTLEIRNAIIFVNGVEQITPPTVKNYYCINCADSKKALDKLRQLNIIVDTYDEVITTWLTKNEAKILASEPYINSVMTILRKPNGTQTLLYENNLPLFPIDSALSWTLHNYGPIIIPFEGMRMNPKQRVESVYHKLICSQFANWNADSTSIEINEDFFFVVGDNRDNSTDSRHFGFVSQASITGNALLVIISRGPNGIRWRRTLKKLN
ncbi:MAG TPA: signal peptidase I [Bacteroidales bacterium]|nr:signal peptidase I [Bacteroidales bacterium]